MSVRGIPVQDLPENQDPEFAYVIDEVTGFKTPLPGGPLDVKETGDEKAEEKADEKPKRRGRPKKTVAKEVGTEVTDSQVEKASAEAEENAGGDEE